MTIMTEKDKKLLIVAGAFIGIVLLASLVIYPLFNSGRNLQTEITEQELLKQENELKVAQVQVLRNRKQEMDEELERLCALYFDPMRSVEVDRLLTGMALEHGVEVESLNIQMPDEDEYFSLKSYRDVVYPQDTAQETEPFEGIYGASVSMSLTGSRENLQQILDEIVSLQPKERLVNYSWSENSTAGSRPYTLSLTVELYICEGVDVYIDKQLEKQALTEAADAAAEAAGDTAD